MKNDFQSIAAGVGISSIAGGLAGHHFGNELSFVKRIAEQANTSPSNVAGVVFAAGASAAVCATIGIGHALKRHVDKQLNEIATQIVQYKR